MIDPLLFHHWHFTSYFVDSAGRAKCGAVLRVEEAEEVGGVPDFIEMWSDTCTDSRQYDA